MAARGSSGLSLVLGVHKPVGMSSHDVVNRVRRALGEKRVGHFGTLDPLASGVLLVGVGPAARLDAYLVEHDKSYIATIAFGQVRNTDDAEGEVIAEASVPAQVGDPAFAESVLVQFCGDIQQVPPAFSAIKRDGKTMYQLARAGETVELEPRPATVYEAKLLSCEANQWRVKFTVSRGTYIRALARDMGAAVGCGAYLAGLERTVLGKVALEDCITLEELEQKSFRPLDPVELLGLPVAEAPERRQALVNNGGQLLVKEVSFEGEVPGAGSLVSLISDNTLKAIYQVSDDGARLLCRCLFAEGVIRG